MGGLLEKYTDVGRGFRLMKPTTWCVSAAGQLRLRKLDTAGISLKARHTATIAS